MTENPAQNTLTLSVRLGSSITCLSALQLGLDPTCAVTVSIDAQKGAEPKVVAASQGPQTLRSYGLARLLPRLVNASLSRDALALRPFGEFLSEQHRLRTAATVIRAAVLEERCPVCCAPGRGDRRWKGSGRARACGAHLCLDQFENEWHLAVEVSPLLRFQRGFGALFELLLAHAAADSASNALGHSGAATHAFEPFPAFLLLESEQTRGRAGYMETGVMASAENKAEGCLRARDALGAALSHPLTDLAEKGDEQLQAALARATGSQVGSGTRAGCSVGV